MELVASARSPISSWLRTRARAVRSPAATVVATRRTSSSALAMRAVTIQPTTKGDKLMTFTVADHTEIDKMGKVSALKDLKVGDRVAVEMPKGKTEAESIKIGAAAPVKPAATAADHKHKG